MELHLQTWVDGAWERAALLEFPQEARGPAGSFTFEYDHEYLLRWIADPPPLAAASLHLPVAFGPVVRRRWPAFLDDIRPMGSAHRWWLRRLALAPGPQSELEILARGTIAPVGNLRIEEAVPTERTAPVHFARQAVVDRESGFLQYAADAGAQVGGATGAGGDSPKLLLRENDRREVWIDVWQDEPRPSDRHFLVKFARGHDERDRTILRSEYVYYRALAELGFETIALDGLALEEGASGPSLWLPRFDVAHRGGREVRYGLESLYSLLDAPPGAFLAHQDCLEALRRVVPASSWASVQLEYLQRDLINLVFGNSDNHGRNTAVLKTSDTVRLAPIYDFAPMRMDLDGITRTTRWTGLEAGGDVNWRDVLAAFGRDEARLREGLHDLAVRLVDLPERLEGLGLPEQTLDFPGLGLRRTAEKLRDWGLL